MTVLRIFNLLAVLQVIGVLIALLFAWGNIESIVFSGPLLSVTGLVLFVVSLFWRLWLGAMFAAAVPLLSVTCFATIATNRWSPTEAYYPINSVLTAFALIHVPLGMLAIRDVRRRVLRPADQFQYQFSIGGMMIATAAIAVTLGLARAIGLIGLPLAVVLWHVVVIGWHLWTSPPASFDQK